MTSSTIHCCSCSYVQTCRTWSSRQLATTSRGTGLDWCGAQEARGVSPGVALPAGAEPRRIKVAGVGDPNLDYICIYPDSSLSSCSLAGTIEPVFSPTVSYSSWHNQLTRGSCWQSDSPAMRSTDALRTSRPTSSRGRRYPSYTHSELVLRDLQLSVAISIELRLADGSLKNWKCGQMPASTSRRLTRDQYLTKVCRCWEFAAETLPKSSHKSLITTDE
ncbi:hypothetical protein BJ170DRAFT_281698 [Xylariales sp. AK1849]|nr:hypothetical protein BJ170DRAFT_281698 [Xylariales sp. AK1849]